MLVVAIAGASPAVAQDKKGKGDSRWCVVCHAAEPFRQGIEHSTHSRLACNECHVSYLLNPHEKVKLPDTEENKPLREKGVRDAAALANCTECHDGLPGKSPGHVPHGKDGKVGGANLPTCLDCHGDPHVIAAAATLPPGKRRLAMNERCEKCHADGKKMEATVGIRAPEQYAHSVHSRKLELGSDRAPGCIDCHGGHAQVKPTTDVAKTCGKCHENATPAFAALESHEPLARTARPVGWFTQKFFAWLTFLTILALCLHVLLDLATTVRVWAVRRPEPDPPLPSGSNGGGTASPAKRYVQRFDVHQRIQHATVIVSFVLLVLTGWPVTTHAIGASQEIVRLFGGIERTGLLHRVAAFGLIAAGIYHLGYLAVLLKRRKLAFSMLPTPVDFVNVYENVLYFFGLRKTAPRFPRYAYFEKFDYWAVFWGMIIMVGSGFIRWLPSETTRLLPAWIYEIAHHAHSDEGLLAGLAIFIWHFYNVHLRPAVFPISWVFLTGRMSVEELEEQHGREYEELVKKGECASLEALGGHGGHRHAHGAPAPAPVAAPVPAPIPAPVPVPVAAPVPVPNRLRFRFPWPSPSRPRLRFRFRNRLRFRLPLRLRFRLPLRLRFRFRTRLRFRLPSRLRPRLPLPPP